jgi:hypothetical protein
MKLVNRTLRRLAGVPGALDISVSLAAMLGRPPRIDTSWRHLERWLEELKESGNGVVPRSGNTDSILFFAIYPQWIDYSLAIAALLVGRGVSVDFWWSGEMTPLADRQRPVREAFWKRQAARKSSQVHHARLGLYSLDQLTPSDETELMHTCAETQARIDVSYLLQKERIDLEGAPRDRAVFDERLKRNLDAVRKVAAAYERKQYSRVLLGNGGVLEFGAVYRYLQSAGIPVTTFESVDIKSRIWISHHESVVRADTSGLWKADEPHVVTLERRERVLRIMHMRQTPGENHLVIPYQKSSPASARSIREKLDLSDAVPTVLICPNVPFDAVFYSGGRQAFSGMWEWLVETCRYLGNRSDCQVVVRCHPAEPYYDTKETARALLHEYLPELPHNIHIVAPTADVSTYSIMEVTDLGIVFASTTGLEMALRGIPVVCGNPSQHYNRKGFSIDPDSREEFFAAIDHYVIDPKARRLTERQIELAYCYADLYFNHWYRHFPWQAQSLWADVKRWPMTRVLSAEGVKEFGPVLDELVSGRAGTSGR